MALVVGLNWKIDIGWINGSIVKIENFLFELGLFLNAEKTQALLITEKHDEGHIKTAMEKKLRISAKSITTEIRLKYSGVMIDENPNFIAHIDYIYARIVFSALYGRTFGLSFLLN